MVTQMGRGEVAVIDMTNKTVIDEDPAAPGTEFLPIGAMPVAIASTPGGVSTFVATAEPGREALFVLPTSCVQPPKTGEGLRDLTLWSACKLPATPGELVILPDATEDASGAFRKTCETSAPSQTDAPSRVDCPANWDAEELVFPKGRRKILVTFPKAGGVALLDARSLYGLQPGKFDACPLERWVPLSTEVPTDLTQTIPSDISSANCGVQRNYTFYTAQTAFNSQPAGIAFKDGHLYVADRGVPLVHDLDLTDPCAPRELSPLVPSSIEDPSRIVTTSDVAVSDLTRDKKRFVYAVDNDVGDLMAFDVSPGNQQRLPLVFKGLPDTPFSSPDRINTNLNGARVSDLMFVTHDVPIVDQSTTSASTGVLCDPNPDATAPANEYRTSSDYSRGAGPSKLRGTFAMLALSDGHVSVIDVEDWDALCRRPVSGNTSDQPNWRGCAKDITSEFAIQNVRTVSDEASCNIVEPHHPRAGRFIATNSTVGTSAPSLPVFPSLSTPTGETSNPAATGSNGSPPKMLAVRYPDSGGVSEVYSGSTMYSLNWCTAGNEHDGTCQHGAFRSGTSFLDVSPTSADNNSILLPLSEPRSYLPTEDFTLTYEGKLFDDRQTGLLEPGPLAISDTDAHFCDQGVQDVAVTSELSSEYVAADADQNVFASNHTDFVQLTSDFDDTHPYWVTPVGSACAYDPTSGVSGITGCRSYFGTAAEARDTRELTILEAYQSRLILEPRRNTPEAAANLHCCFPGTVKYTVRAAHQWVFRGQQSLSRVMPDATDRCKLDCSARKSRIRTRAIEITSSATLCDISGNCRRAGDDSDAGTSPLGIGPATAPYAGCIVNDNRALEPGQSLPPGCVFDSLKGRFAVYSGTKPSVRDMTFAWRVSGGFVPYQLSLANAHTGSSIMPQSMTFAPNLNAFFVVDSVSGGVFELVLDPFTINGNPYL
jgi:hypothetical protein